MNHKPTPEQQAVIDFICDKTKGSLIVEALAGSAKTTTLKMAMEAYNPGPMEVLAVAFNKRIAIDLEKSLPANVVCKTMNSLGHSAWGRTVGKRLTLDTDKVYNLVAELLPMPDKYDAETAEMRKLVKLGVEVAKTHGYVPQDIMRAMQGRTVQSFDEWLDMFNEKADDEGLVGEAEGYLAGEERAQGSLSEEVIATAQRAIAESIRQAFQGCIDFSDQIYMPVCFSGGWQRFPVVLVDEAQDLNEMNHIMLRKICAGRLIAVGDSRQAIYAFRGALSYSMTSLKEQWEATTLVLTTCFRCPLAVVKHVQRLVPQIQPFKEGGSVTNKEYAWVPGDLKPGSAILCRNNAPLIKTAFVLLEAGVSCHILGSDIGRGVIWLVKDLGANATDIESFTSLLEAWYTAQPERKRAKALDKRNSILAAAEHAKDVPELINKVESLFKRDSGTITLSTGHKCKGFEWDDVYHLNKELIPSKFAKSPDDYKQEENLLYVIETRAKQSLTMININTKG